METNYVVNVFLYDENRREILVDYDHEIFRTIHQDEIMEAIEKDLETQCSSKYVDYLIYMGTEEEMKLDSFWEDTDYYISYIKIDGEYKIHLYSQGENEI